MGGVVKDRLVRQWWWLCVEDGEWLFPAICDDDGNPIDIRQ